MKRLFYGFSVAAPVICCVPLRAGKDAALTSGPPWLCLMLRRGSKCAAPNTCLSLSPPEESEVRTLMTVLPFLLPESLLFMLAMTA